MSDHDYPRDALRQRLAALGIPHEAHASGVLAGMLPVCCNGALPGDCDPDALAESLIYLIEKEIVRAPCRLDTLIDPEWGAHRCQFYRSADDLLEFLGPFFTRGLQQGEYCLWLSADEGISAALQTALAGVLRERPDCASAIEFGLRDEWYLDGAGELRTAAALIASWKQKVQQALDDGYRGLRCAADARGIDRRLWKDIAEYECVVDSALQGLNIKAVCAYPLLDCKPGQLDELRGCHQETFAKGDAWWHRITATDPTEAAAVLMALQGGRQ
ncbi:MAG: MEDS domain-containing protein [Betaproteobacteria bacterium]